MTCITPPRRTLICPTRPGFNRALQSAFLAFSLIFLSRGVFAEEVSAENKAAARDLARDGIKLAQEGKCEEALNPLSRAEALYHAPTILTWIGQCQIEMGRLVEGTETLNRVVREKTADDAPEAFKQAKERAGSLIESTRPKIAKLTINVEPKDAPELVIRINERAVSSALIGAARPSDPGKLRISASAPGYEEVIREIVLGPGAVDTIELQLKALESSNTADEVVTPPASSQPTQESATWVGWSIVGLGGALVGAGGVTGYLAISKKNQLDCPTSSTCPSSETDDLKSARLQALLSTVFFGTGAAALTTGIVLLVTGQPKVLRNEVGGVTFEPRLGFGSAAIVGAF